VNRKSITTPQHHDFSSIRPWIPSPAPPLRPAPHPFSRKTDVAIALLWVRLGLPTAHAFCDQNARNSGKSIILFVAFDSARSGASMHVGIMVLMAVVELLRRARGNFASSLLFATMTGPFPRSTSRTSTRHPSMLLRLTSSMSPTYYSMLPLPNWIYFRLSATFLGLAMWLLTDAIRTEIDSSTNPTSQRVDN